MASSASTSTASIEPAVHTKSTGGNNAKSSAAASQAPTSLIVETMKIGKVRKAIHGGSVFTYTSRSGHDFRWKCEVDNCRATLKTYYICGTHYYNSPKPPYEHVHTRKFPRLSGGGPSTPRTPHDGSKRKEDSCADKPQHTANGDVPVPAKTAGGVFKKLFQDTPQRKAEDAAGDNSTIESTKGSGAGNLVDSRAAGVRQSPVHFQHPRGSNEPGTSARPSSDQGAEESEILPPPTPPATTDHDDTVRNDADDGEDSDCILIDDPINGDIEKKPLWGANAGGSFEKVSQELELLREEVGGLRQEIHGLKKVYAAPPAASLPPPVLPKLPMKTAEDFAALETFLADENNFERMVSHLKSFDGSTLEEKADGMMTGLFSLELAATYNYSKRSKGKLVFEGTLAEKAVRRAAMESFPELASKEYTFHLRKRFRYSYAKLKKQEEDAYARMIKNLPASGGARSEARSCPGPSMRETCRHFF
ncbi:uncharacterized protein ISCGN_031779 [Ixodes scapularis]